MKILVTGAAGFIGSFVAQRLLSEGNQVIGIDNINDYYSVSLKYARLEHLTRHDSSQNFQFLKGDISDKDFVQGLFREHRPDAVVHLAAQAGVRYSMENPRAYIESNISGFLEILEACRAYPVQHLVYASSSSVYGDTSPVPFDPHQPVSKPVSLYAATKLGNELMAFTYNHLYKIPVTGLRFFTVYGPWGRPDMAPMLFADAILKGKPLKVFNGGDMKRDFTFVDDIVNGIVRLLPLPEVEATVHNIGRGKPIDLMRFIQVLEDCLGKPAILQFEPMQAGDVPITWADTSSLARVTGYRPTTSLEQGVKAFAEWFQGYYYSRLDK